MTMKRSLQQLNNIAAEGSPPAIKRACSESKISEDDQKPENSFYLAHQNRELSKELKRKQLKINEYEEQTSFYNSQIQKIEEFIGFIDRVWHQFEFDISTLLETLGYPQINIEENEETSSESAQVAGGSGTGTGAGTVAGTGAGGGGGGAVSGGEECIVWSSLLQQYLAANLTYYESIPGCISDELDIDEWSNELEIDEARIQALENCLDTSSGLEIVKEELVNRLEFTKKNVEKLYEIVNQQTEGQLATILIPLTDDRNIRTELDLLRDQVTKYKHEVITISAELACVKRKLKKAEKVLLETPNSITTTSGVLQNDDGAGQTRASTSSSQSLSTSSEKKDSSLIDADNHDSMNVVEEIVKEVPLCRQNGEIVDSRLIITEAVTKLQQQLEDAHQRMVAAEKSLTDYMATAPATPQITNHSTEISRLQKLLTEVRTFSNKKLADVRVEKSTLMAKIAELERGMGELVTKTEAKIDQMAIACAEELAKEKLEKEKIQFSLKTAEAEVKLMANMQTQITEMQAVHDTSKSKVEKLTERVKSQAKTIMILEEHLNSSKQREETLERSLKEIASQHERNGSTSKGVAEEDEEGVVHENSMVSTGSGAGAGAGSGLGAGVGAGVGGATAAEMMAPNYQMLSQLLSNSQTRCKELEAELADAKANMDELIVEIEAVASEEEKTRTQNSRLLKQINEGHNVHKSVLQENLRLHQDITTLQEKESVANSKVENITAHMKLIETTMQQLRQSEQVTRTELTSSVSSLSDLKIVNETQLKKIEELELKLQQTTEESQKYQQRLLELRERCNLLTTTCDEERSRRLELERLRDDDRREREKESNRISVLMAKATENETKSDQSTMLEMTLNMLRCSVCKDRFKQVAITKCFHLFCKECINENLKNRNRKCPACGEKFGQEDVKSVFFAH